MLQGPQVMLLKLLLIYAITLLQFVNGAITSSNDTNSSFQLLPPPEWFKVTTSAYNMEMNLMDRNVEDVVLAITDLIPQISPSKSPSKTPMVKPTTAFHHLD